MAAEKCRLCLSKRKLTSIFNMKDSVMISTKVMSLARVKIYPDDGLPSFICSKCIKILDTCLNFINVCEKSDIKLRAVRKRKLTLKAVKTEVNDEIQSETDSIDNDCENGIFDLQNDSRTLNEAVLCESLVNKTDKFVLDNDDEELKVGDKKLMRQQCFTCGKVMSSRFRLKTHLRTHTGERPFTCPHCNKNFSLAQNLKVHLRVHTGEKPLSCDVCGETFAHSSGLSVHRRKHTGQTPYKCTLCPRSFRTIGHLQYHIRRHTGEKNFECDTCGRAFITRSDLKQHLISHTGDKPHVCCICGLRLTRATHLIRHMRALHNEDEPYVCPECPSKFSNKGYLDKHKKIHIVASEDVKEM